MSSAAPEPNGSTVRSSTASAADPPAQPEDSHRASRFYETILSTISDFAYLFDLEGRFRFVNKPLLDLWGLKLEEAVGKNFFELKYPDPLAGKLQQQIQQVIETKARVVDETSYTSPTGATGYFEYIFSPVLAADGSVEAVAGSTRDITGRRTADERARIILESISDAFFALGPDWRFIYVNAQAYRILGRPSDDLMGKNLWDEYPGLHGSVFEPIYRRAMDERVAGSITSYYPDHDRWYEVRSYPSHDGISVYFRDTSAQKRIEAEREKLLESEMAARTEAERANSMKDEFLATLSHELRTPLNAILGWAQILSTGGRDAEDFLEGVRTIERNARAQAQIIEDLLDMSRIISGKIRLDVQRIELAPTVQAAIETVKPAADARGIRLQTVLDPHAGQVSGDPNRLHQVCWNLLSNAVKFTPRGGRVQVVLQRVNSHLEVSVTDTGEGIAPEFLPHVFDRFRQADATTTRRHGGLGLGLAIVRQLVELHGGSVRVASAGLGKGAVFTVSLPLMVMHPEREPQTKREHPRSIATSDFGALMACSAVAGVKVLVLDDEPDARALLRRFLEECDAIVETAATAEEVLAKVQAFRPDVFVSDIGMPGEDGYSVIRRIRQLGAERGGNVPAIALTAYARVEDRVRCISAGFQMHAAKPVESAELITMVASLAGRAGAAGEKR